MIKVDYHVSIRRDPTAVYDYVTDVERIPEWQHVAGVKQGDQGVDPGPSRSAAGSRWSAQARGGLATIDATVTTLEPGSRFDFHTIDNDGFVGDFATTLTPTGDGTDLHWAVRMQPPACSIESCSRSSRARSASRPRPTSSSSGEARVLSARIGSPPGRIVRDARRGPLPAHGTITIIELDDIVVGQLEFEPGWRWSEVVKPIAGTEFCEYHHIGVTVSGTVRVRMRDGSELESAPERRTRSRRDTTPG